MLPQACHCHLIDVCRTRWVSRIDGLGVFIEIYSAIVASLEEISNNVGGTWNVESRTKASGINHAIVTFQFAVCLIIISRCLEVTRPLTKQLQSASSDAGAARAKIDLLYLILDNMRTEIDTKHNVWYNEATVISEAVGTVPAKPRTAGRQMHRENVSAESTSQYFKRTISIPFLDHLLNQIHARFSETNLDAMDALYAMPNSVMTNSEWLVGFSRFAKKYE